MKRSFTTAAFGLILVAVALRFVFLETSPPGFFFDEASIAAQTICVRQSGYDLHHTFLPLFSTIFPGPGSGHTTAAYIYPAAIWSAVFGDSIGAFRAFAALFGALAVAGVFFLAGQLWKSPRAAVFAALACAISPWAFQFSRIAWDAALTPAYLVWALYFLVRGGTRARLEGAIGGILLSLASYAYPPLRPLCAFVLVAFPVFLLAENSHRRRAVLPFIAAALLFSLPMIYLSATGQIMGRFQEISIANADYLKPMGGYSPLLVAKLFIGNLLSHFSPGYLFWSGDINLRHSTQYTGEWSWMDALAPISVPLLVWRKRMFASLHERRLFGLICAFYVIALVPSAMTWDSNPHALRSIGAYPLLALATGFILDRVCREWRKLETAALAVGALFFAYFAANYFLFYPAVAAEAFDAPVVALIQQIESTHDPAKIEIALKQLGEIVHYPEFSLAYYRLRSGVIRCEKEPQTN